MIKYLSGTNELIAEVENIKTKEKFVVFTINFPDKAYSTVVVRASDREIALQNYSPEKIIFALNSSTWEEAQQNHTLTAGHFEQLRPEAIIRKYKIVSDAKTGYFFGKEEDKKKYEFTESIMAFMQFAKELAKKYKENYERNPTKIEAIKWLTADGWNRCISIDNPFLKEVEPIITPEDISRIGTQKAIDIYIEFLVFDLHCLDRTLATDGQVRAIVGEEEREIIMDKVVAAFSNEMAAYSEDFGTNYNAGQIDYGSYKKTFVHSPEGLKNTLFWEFGKKISNLINGQLDIATIMRFTIYESHNFISTTKALRSILEICEQDKNK